MKTIGILARKGGAGQSTLPLHWAVEAERQLKGRIAVIDMDPQQTSVNWSTRTLGRSAGWPPALLISHVVSPSCFL